MFKIDVIRIGKSTRVLGRNEAVRQNLRIARREAARVRLARMKAKRQA